MATRGRRPLNPKEATQAMFELMPNKRGFLSKLKTLVEAGANINAKHRNGMSILHRIALFGGSSAAAKYVLDKGGDTHFPATFKETPLFLAISSDNVEVTRVLMGDDVSPNFFDGKDMTPLFYALEYESNRVAKFLINKGADIDVVNKRGQIPLHLVATKNLARRILEKGGDPDARDNTGMTPLHYAADYDNPEVAELLASVSSDVNAKGGRDNQTPLHYAKSAETAEIILKHGGDPNARSSHGMTPLHGVDNDLKLIRVFAHYGGDLNAVDNFGRTPLDYASTGEFTEALIRFGADRKKTYEWRQRNDFSKKEGKQHPTKSMYNQQKEDTQDSSKSSSQPDFLTSLNELARQKKNNPIIGREKELKQVANALRRKGMRGTLLVGDPGVGKTAIVEGLAYLLANDELPELAGREIYSLDVGSMWGHKESKFVGQLQKRVNDALKFIAAEPDKRILFIDEIHQLLGGGFVSDRGSPPITDMLKPYLGRGEIQLIGATTHDEFQRIIEGDLAIVDRLLRIDINEPSTEETLTILRGSKTDFEEHYGVTIGNSVLQAALNLSDRYLSGQQPRKAITLLDEAAASLAHDAKRLNKKHLAAIIADKVGIEVATILKSQNEKIAGLLPALQQQIYGQDQALEEVDSSLAIAYADLADETRPRAVMLFVGATGVGKTVTAKEVARHLFDSEDNFISVDMSGYKHPTSVVALTERLTRAVKATPHAVILLDEVEKSHREVQHLLLQLLDEGRLNDNRQRQVDFTNTIIVMTTNSKRLKHDFAPELLNRINNTIHFRKLNTNISLRLVQKQLDELNHSFQEKNITVVLSKAAQQIIADVGYHQEYGAREMTRMFERLVKRPLAKIINGGLVRSGKEYHLDLQPAGSKRVKASVSVDGEVLMEMPISTKTSDIKNDNPRGII